MPAASVGGAAHWVEAADGSVVNLDACFRVYIDATGRLLASFNFGDVVLANRSDAVTALANLKPYLSSLLPYLSMAPPVTGP